MTLHIFTLTWNGLENLKRLHCSLEDAVEPLNTEVIWYIRDNGSTDGTKEWLKNYHKGLDFDTPRFGLKPLFIGHNRDNFAQGINSLHFKTIGDVAKNMGRSIGASQQVSMYDDYYLLLNNDVEFADETSLFNMMALMNDPKVGVVGARLLYPGTNKLQHAGVIFGKRYGEMPYHYRHREESDSDAEKNRYFQAVTAACCLIRARDFLLLDEAFNWAFEDIDLCLRIGQKKKIAYCGQTKIYHTESASLQKNPVNKLFLQSNVKRFKEKWWGKYDIDHEKYLKRPNYRIIK